MRHVYCRNGREQLVKQLLCLQAGPEIDSGKAPLNHTKGTDDQRLYIKYSVSVMSLPSSSRVLLEKLTVSHLEKKFLVIYITRMFILAFTTAPH
jgi:hypothetical protein